jgi:hypothetical protein
VIFFVIFQVTGNKNRTHTGSLVKIATLRWYAVLGAKTSSRFSNIIYRTYLHEKLDGIITFITGNKCRLFPDHNEAKLPLSIKTRIPESNIQGVHDIMIPSEIATKFLMKEHY